MLLYTYSQVSPLYCDHLATHPRSLRSSRAPDSKGAPETNEHRETQRAHLLGNIFSVWDMKSCCKHAAPSHMNPWDQCNCSDIWWWLFWSVCCYAKCFLIPCLLLLINCYLVQVCLSDCSACLQSLMLLAHSGSTSMLYCSCHSCLSALKPTTCGVTQPVMCSILMALI